MQFKKPEISIILPIYNQEDQIEKIVKTCNKVNKNLSAGCEYLLVVNGSHDNSYTLAKLLTADKNNFRVFDLRKGGWGRAVKYGLDRSRGKYICYTNSARTEYRDLINIIKHAMVNDGVLVKATRITRESLFRKAGSILYNLLVRLMYRVPVWDINGTPKVIPRKVLDKIKLISPDDLIDAELMIRCVKMNIPIIEIPVDNTKRLSGKSTTSLVSALKMYRGLFILKDKMR